MSSNECRSVTWHSRCGSSSFVMGGNLGSSRAAIRAYLRTPSGRLWGAKVPIHPLRLPFLFHVTKRGHFKGWWSWSCPDDNDNGDGGGGGDVLVSSE